MNVPSSLLMDIWRCDLFNGESINSKVGPLIWSSQNFYCPIADIESEENEVLNLCCQRTSRRRTSEQRHGVTAKSLYKELKPIPPDPHVLVRPFCFGVSGSVVPSEKQPFKVAVHPQFPLICDIHAHLSEAEVIGLLAGRWDRDNNLLYVQIPIPCTSLKRSDDDGSIDVEMDPEAEFVARKVAEKFDLEVIGWYHSHPRFRADPSIIDIENQQTYQQIMESHEAGPYPYVGLIISTFDRASVSAVSQHQWFMVSQYMEDVSAGIAYMPVNIEVDYYSLNCQEKVKKSQIELSVRLNSADSQMELSNPSEKDRIHCENVIFDLVEDSEELTIKYHDTTQLSEEKSLEISTEDEFKEKALNVSIEDETNEKAQSLSTDDHTNKNYFELIIVDSNEPAIEFSLSDALHTPQCTRQSARLKDRKRKLFKDSDFEPDLVPHDLNNSSSDYNNIVISICDPLLQSSSFARSLLIASPPELHVVAKISVALGFYYCRSKQRMELSRKWKGSTRQEKLRLSVEKCIKRFVWVEETENKINQSEFLSNLLSFLQKSWQEFSPETGNIKRKQTRKFEEFHTGENSQKVLRSSKRSKNGPK
jgi:proteasome lid subunit RPN8/RPN11